jgi:hypothetical protein
MAREVLKDVVETPEEQIHALGQTVAQEKFKNMQKDQIINKLGQELTQLKLQLMQK